jgi:pyruvate/2-oxoglutarate dehydrogenase complex dihydrolipoamide acyltransferase (E2) component
VKKRPVVIESEAGDSIAIRSMCIMTLSFDHRIIDGAVADQFMARVRQIIETAKYAL